MSLPAYRLFRWRFSFWPFRLDMTVPGLVIDAAYGSRDDTQTLFRYGFEFLVFNPFRRNSAGFWPTRSIVRFWRNASDQQILEDWRKLVKTRDIRHDILTTLKSVRTDDPPDFATFRFSLRELDALIDALEFAE